MNSPKVLITGVAGFIGAHLLDALLSKGYNVVGIDNLSVGKIENIQHNIDNPRFDFHKIDIRDFDALNKTCNNIKKIIHLAAYKIPRYGNALETLEINSKGTWNVLEIAKEKGCKVVFASTSDVYGKNPNMPFSEENDLVIGSSTVMRWSYAISKLFDEHLIFAFKDAFGIPVTILRYFSSYGSRQYLSWWGGPQGVFIDAIFKNKELEIHGDGKQKRSFIYISDLVSATVAAVEKKEVNGEIINIGTTEEVSILELAKLIKELSNTPEKLKLKFVPYSSFAGGKYEDVQRKIPDITKAQKLLGFAPKVSLKKGLSLTIDWYRKTHKW